jgi:hypothetical protein
LVVFDKFFEEVLQTREVEVLPSQFVLLNRFALVEFIGDGDFNPKTTAVVLGYSQVLILAEFNVREVAHVEDVSDLASLLFIGFLEKFALAAKGEQMEK